MSYETDNPPKNGASALSADTPLRRLFDTVWRAIAHLIAWRALKVAEAQLSALDNRMLKDLGIDRSEIGSVLRNRMNERRNGAV